MQKLEIIIEYHRQGDDRPDDGGSTHLRNVGLLQRDCIALYPRRLSSSFVTGYVMGWYRTKLPAHCDRFPISSESSSSACHS
jgi:hypothetical protein